MDSSPKPSAPSIWSLVLIPTLITLVVTIVRTVGELQDWNPTWFGTGAGEKDANGQTVPTGMFGIVWLIPIVGLYFGNRIKKSVGGPGIGKAAGLFFTAMVVFAVGIAGLMTTGLMTFPDPDGTEVFEPTGFLYAVGVVIVAIALGFAAWGRLAATLLLYSFLARIPVMIVTYLSVSNEWDTHYGKLAPNVPPKEGMDLVLFLCVPQATFWIAFTVLVGGLFGALGAAMAGGKSK